MDLGERVRDWSLRDFLLIPLRGTLGGWSPNKIKERYYVDNPDALLNKEKSQKSAEIWLPIVAVPTICLAYRGLSFSSSNTLLENIVNKASFSFFFSLGLGIVDNIFRFTRHYNRNQLPGTLSIETFYKLIIEEWTVKIFGREIKKRGVEDRLLSFLDSVQNYVQSAQSQGKNFYFCKLPNYTHSFTI